MNYEKKYKDALEKARQLCIYPTTKPFTSDLQDLFPELKESEDERIRKWIIDDIRFNMNNEPLNNSEYRKKAEKAITWLEKQREQPTLNEEDEKIKEEIINFFECQSKEEPTRKDIHNKWIAWLKKQDEPKQDPCENCNDMCLNCQNFPCVEKREFERGKSVREIIKEEKIDNANKVVVEPKFKVGDWITDGEKVWKIGYIEDDTYIEHRGLISAGGFIESIDKHYHLWSIKDAKDGDALEFVDHEKVVVGIVSFVNEKTGKVDVSCLLEDDKFKIGNFYALDTISPHPATKEQRDLLFSKMKEAGYEWDAEKKEPKKIKSKFKVGDVIEFTGYGHNRYTIQEIHGASHYTNSDGQSMEMSYTDANFNLVEQKPTDEEMVEVLRTEYEKGRANAIAEMQVAWNEDDEVTINRIVAYLENLNVADDILLRDINWLKSLKDRYTWKQNDRQIEELKDVIDAEIVEVEDNDCSMCGYTHLEICTDEDLSKICKAGDKAKVIIIKQK